MKSAIFLDRDGTINVEKDYLIDPDEFEFIPGTLEALKRFQDAGFLLIVVTNQSGIGRGYFAETEVVSLHQFMQRKLSAHAVTLNGIYWCPHHPTAANAEYLKDCDCRKGQPGMLLQAAAEHDIDLNSSYMVGDKVADLEAGQAAGCKTILVRSGHGKKYVSIAGQYGATVVDDLAAAAEMILSSTR